MNASLDLLPPWPFTSLIRIETLPYALQRQPFVGLYINEFILYESLYLHLTTQGFLLQCYFAKAEKESEPK